MRYGTSLKRNSMNNLAYNLQISSTEPKWTRVVLILLVLSMMNSCSKETTATTDALGEYTTKTIQHDGVERTYHMYLPTNFDPTNSSPLVVALHGRVAHNIFLFAL